MSFLARKSYTSTTADYTIDLGDMQEGSRGHVEYPAIFDIEVVGNSAEVTMTGKGTFSSSAHFSVSDGAFPINGGKKSITNFALSELKFSRTGTTAYTINITRRIIN